MIGASLGRCKMYSMFPDIQYYKKNDYFVFVQGSLSNIYFFVNSKMAEKRKKK